MHTSQSSKSAKTMQLTAQNLLAGYQEANQTKTHREIDSSTNTSIASRIPTGKNGKHQSTEYSHRLLQPTRCIEKMQGQSKLWPKSVHPTIIWTKQSYAEDRKSFFNRYQLEGKRTAIKAKAQSNPKHAFEPPAISRIQYRIKQTFLPKRRRLPGLFSGNIEQMV